MPQTNAPLSSSEVTSEIRRAVDILCRIAGVRRIWFFGSHAAYKGRPGSDLDFAVEGLPSEALFSTLGELMLGLRAPVDLVRWEDAGNALRGEILRQGTVVYAT
ncbi:nucleotidyltransferase family protein [Chthoniobacter flavus]|uniref:nucleotidyltransferase family protein n=1 Tax=Chthoniobacter flavus TaxID=191863 RepID=UPI00104BB351|nr:nucleotidyltransferase domain-containing protein [Chthoniobacter flavus]